MFGPCQHDVPSLSRRKAASLIKEHIVQIRLVISLVVVAFAAQPADAQQAMKAADIQKMLQNKSIALTCKDGTNASGRYKMTKTAGVISGTYAKPGMQPMRDEGQVRAEGDNLCIRFKTLNNGDERCFGVTQVATNRYRLSVSGFDACDVTSR